MSLGNEKIAAVKAANRCLYDAIAEEYEALDGRRSVALERWLHIRLAALRAQAPGDRLLDMGAGSGLVSRCSQGIFARRIAIDISPVILAKHKANFDFAIAADADLLPFPDSAFDAIACFAVLHHLPRFEPMIDEIHRVLAPGGIFYADHDLDLAFARRWRLLLDIYRFLCRPRTKYAKFIFGNSAAYDLAEHHSQGIDAQAIAQLFTVKGFTVDLSYHWHGLAAWCDFLFGASEWPRGWAPLVAFRCRKRIAAD